MVGKVLTKPNRLVPILASILWVYNQAVVAVVVPMILVVMVVLVL